MKQFKPRILLSIFVLVATFFSLIYYITFTVSNASTNVSAATSAWNPIFTDEFDGPLDSSKWRNHYDGSGQDCENGRSNGERQAYMASNSYTENGKLLLKAENKSNCGVPYTSGSVSTLGKFDYQYGYAEASIKSTKGKGMWPAFWLVPSKVDTWLPEIDILEQVDVNKEENVMTAHYNDASGKEIGNTGNYKPGGSLADTYHTYGTLWMPDKLVWYIDGVERFRDTNPAHIAQQKLFIILNLAVGGSWPGYPDASTPFPGYLSTDWVRVYQGGDESSVSQVLNGAKPSSNAANSSSSVTSAMVSQSSISKSSQNSSVNSSSNDCSVASSCQNSSVKSNFSSKSSSSNQTSSLISSQKSSSSSMASSSNPKTSSNSSSIPQVASNSSSISNSNQTSSSSSNSFSVSMNCNCNTQNTSSSKSNSLISSQISSQIVTEPIIEKADSSLIKSDNGKIDIVSSTNTPVIKVGDSIKLTFTGLKSKDGSPLASFKVRVSIKSPNDKIINILTTTDSNGNIELDLTPPKLSWLDIAAFASSYTVESGDLANLNSQAGNYAASIQTLDSKASSKPVTWKVESTFANNVIGTLARTGGFSFIAPILLLLSLGSIYYVYSKKPKFLNFKRK